MRSRRWVVVAVLVVLGALAFWWTRRDAREGDATAARDDTKKLAARKAIDAEVEPDARAPSKLPWARPGTSVSGRVLDETGKPIASADVCIALVSERLPTALTREPRCAQSSTDGAWLVADVPPVRVEVSAGAATFIPAAYDPPGDHDWIELHAGQATTGIDIVLKGGGVQIHGVVKDISGGVIEGALLMAVHGWGTRGAALTKSDADGKFSTWVAPGETSVRALAEGYANGWKSGTAPGYTFELLMTPESVLAGRVVSKDGKPVADAHVTTDSRYTEDHVAYTDADGMFRIDRLEPGRYKPRAETARGHGEIAQSILLGLGQTVDGVEITLHPMAALRGRVVVAGDAESPCEDGNVYIKGKTTQHGASAETATDGSVELIALPPDTYEVSVGCRDYVPEQKYPELVIAEAGVDEQVWAVKAGLGVRGIVVDHAGAPIARARVSVQPVGTAARAQRTNSWGERTDDAGRFEVGGLLAGTYELDVLHEDHLRPETRPQLVLADGEVAAEQRIVLEQGGTIVGRVVDAAKRGVPHVEVSVVGKQVWAGDATTADDGSFTLEPVRPGEVRVVATREGAPRLRAPGTSDDDVQGVAVTVRAGESSTIEIVVEEQFGKITGKVVDADGAPVDDAFVHSTRESDSAAANEKRARMNVRFGQWDRTPALTEQDGSFTLDDLSLGTHTLMAMRKGGGEGVAEHVETGASGVVIRLSDGGKLSGTVTLGSGGAPKRFEINAQERSLGIRRNESFFETGGVWTLADLPAGKYIVGVSAAEGSTDTEVEIADGAEQSGIELVLTPKLDVTGTLVDATTGAPVPGMKVGITSRKGGGGISLGGGGSGDMEDVSDDAGNFTVRAAPSGAVRITVTPRSFLGGGEQTYGWHNVNAQIPAGTTAHALAPIRLVRARVKPGERGGDLGIVIKESDPTAELDEVPLEIAVLRPGSAAAGSELKVGDVIVEVDGHDVTGANRYLYGALTRVKEGAAVTIGVKDGGEVKLVAGPPI